MSIYVPPTLNAVDFALTSYTPPDLTPAFQELTAYTPPALSAVNFELTAYTPPIYPYVGWELLPGVGPVNYTLVCAAGAYSYLGQTATLNVARRLALDAGAYAYAGNVATLQIARFVALDSGAYNYAGNDATLDYVPGGVDYTLVCEAGAYVYTGQDATLDYQPVYVVIDTHDGGKKRRHKNPFEDKSRKELRVLLEKAISVEKETEKTEVVAQPVEAQKTADLSREQVRQVIADIYTNVAMQKAAKEFDDEEAVLLLL